MRIFFRLRNLSRNGERKRSQPEEFEKCPSTFVLGRDLKVSDEPAVQEVVEYTVFGYSFSCQYPGPERFIDPP